MKYLQDKAQRVFQALSAVLTGITVIAIPIILSIEQKKTKAK